MTERTETFVAGIAPHVQKSGQGMTCRAYTVTIPTQNDTVVFDDFDTAVVDVYATVVATGVLNATTISTKTVTFTSATTGAMKCLVWGY